MKKILVVEDNSIDLSVVTKRLSAEGYEVASAVDGSEAVRVAGAFKPDLMVLDLTLMNEDRWNTPLWDGFTVLEWMRRVVPNANFPVVVYTNSPYSEIVARARATGVCSVFDKTEDIGELLAKITELLNDRKTQTRVLRN